VPVPEVLTWSVSRLLAAYADGSVTPRDYLEACLARLAEVAPVVNAVGDVYADEARAAADEAGRRWREGTARPLEGVPVGGKDEAAVAGTRSTDGSLLYTDVIVEETEPLVQRLVDAGAIVHVRTLTPEFSIAFWTHSRLWGVTRNPWNPAYDVGGSSGGSAAALAAGITPLATGSDIGGSIRMPASCCGVVGYKPPHGRVPIAGLYGLDDWCHVGPLTRTVGDAALMTDLVAGPHPSDHNALPPMPPIGVPRGDVAGLRVAVSYDLGDWPVTDEVRSAVRETAAALQAAGAVVTEVDLVVERELVRRASNAHHRSLMADDVRADIEGREDLVNPYTTYWIELVHRTDDSFADGRRIETEITGRVEAVLAEHDVLLCPANAVPALAAGVDYATTPFELDGQRYEPFHDLFLVEVFNIANRCPVLTVPAGRSADGVPIGVQVVGRPYDERTTFEVGAAIERLRPWPLVADVTAG
jgi:Asp-tRNA(Asn)/Glu-tRNA(Gln) amidotransferase A subunit family amidase